MQRVEVAFEIASAAVMASFPTELRERERELDPVPKPLQYTNPIKLTLMEFSFKVNYVSNYVSTYKFEPTGCPRVRGYFQTPSFSGIGGRILKPFGMVNAHTGRFGLVYDNP